MEGTEAMAQGSGPSVTEPSPGATSKGPRSALMFGSSLSNIHTNEAPREDLHMLLTTNKKKAAVTKPPEERTEEDLQVLEDLITRAKFGQTIDREKRLQMCKYLQFVKYPKDAIIFEQGSQGDEFYVIIKGGVGVAVADGIVSRMVTKLHSGESFGEMALLEQHSKRNATIVCLEDSEFMTLSRKWYDSILKADSVELLQRIEFLRQVPLFSALPLATMSHLARVMTRRELTPRTVIARQDAEVEEICFIIRGSVKMVREMPNDFSDVYPVPLPERSESPEYDEGAIAPLLPPGVPRTHKRGNVLGADEDIHLLERSVASVIDTLRVRSPTGSSSAGSGTQSPRHEEGELVLPPLPGASHGGWHKKEGTRSGLQKIRAAVKSALVQNKGANWKRREDFMRVVRDAVVKQREEMMKKLTPEMLRELQVASTLLDRHHVFLEVSTAGRFEAFGGGCVIKNYKSPFTIVTASTTTVYSVSKFVALRVLEPEFLQRLADEALLAVDDKMLKRQYLASLDWSAYKKSLVKEVLGDIRSSKILHPTYCWDTHARNLHSAPNAKRWK